MKTLISLALSAFAFGCIAGRFTTEQIFVLKLDLPNDTKLELRLEPNQAQPLPPDVGNSNASNTDKTA
jgi:hypothetical protein